MVKFAVINPNEKELIEKIRISNKDETSIWKVPNLFVPIATVVLALICHLAFSANRWCLIAYVNLVVNGSLPLIAINQISALGLQFFDYDQSKESKFKIISTKGLRIKLFYYSLAIFLVGVIAFAHQVINNPFKEYIEPILIFLISVGLIWFSSYVSKNIFMLQDSLITKTFDGEIVKDMKQKGHGNNW